MYESLATFVVVWVVYYFFIRKNTPDLNYTIIFCLVVMLTQLGANSASFFQKCKGSNFVELAMITFIPWTFIFSLVCIGLVLAPSSISEGLKSPFSNVLGYFAVVDKANILLNDILVDPSVSKTLMNVSAEEKVKMESTSQVILKIMGNNSILINEITPGNFDQYWQILTPLMKSSSTEDQKKQQKDDLLKIVNTRDYIGEGIWVLYTGILCVAVADYQINLVKCSKSVVDMENQYSEYLEEKKILDKQMNKTKL